METLTPFGVASEYSWMRSGWAGGHCSVILKSASISVVMKERQPGIVVEHLPVLKWPL
jgi:hypothetical protein